MTRRSRRPRDWCGKATATTIDREELQARLDEFLARAAPGKRILVHYSAGHVLALGPVEDATREIPASAPRRRHRAARAIDEVLAEDRGA